MKNFVIVVDGEVVGNYTISDEQMKIRDFSKTIAIFSSNPVFIPYDEIVPIDSKWNGKKFIPPVE